MTSAQAGFASAEQPIAPQEALGAASVPTLLLRAQQGEEAAFKALGGLYKERVYAACLAITQTQSGAEALTYRVFAMLFHHIGDFQDERHFLNQMDQWTICFSIGYLRNQTGWGISIPPPSRC